MCAYNPITAQRTTCSTKQGEIAENREDSRLTVFVRGNWMNVQSSNLQRYFEQFGKIRTMTSREEFEIHSTLKVCFAASGPVTQICASSSHWVDGVELFCSQLPPVELLLEEHPHLVENSLLIESIPAHATEYNILHRFKRFGLIVAITLYRDSFGISLCKCSITFANYLNHEYLLKTRKKYSHRILNTKVFIFRFAERQAQLQQLYWKHLPTAKKLSKSGHMQTAGPSKIKGMACISYNPTQDTTNTSIKPTKITNILYTDVNNAPKSAEDNVPSCDSRLCRCSTRRDTYDSATMWDRSLSASLLLRNNQGNERDQPENMDIREMNSRLNDKETNIIYNKPHLTSMKVSSQLIEHFYTENYRFNLTVHPKSRK